MENSFMENKEYAGFWLRFGAMLIDVAIMLVVLYIPLTFIYGEAYWTGDKFINGFWDVLLGYVTPFVVTIWFWRRYLGTPGKMRLRLKVVDAQTGAALSTKQAVGRYFAYILAILPLFLGFAWIGFDKRKQGWHDKLAGSVVIREAKPIPRQAG